MLEILGLKPPADLGLPAEILKRQELQMTYPKNPSVTTGRRGSAPLAETLLTDQSYQPYNSAARYSVDVRSVDLISNKSDSAKGHTPRILQPLSDMTRAL